MSLALPAALAVLAASPAMKVALVDVDAPDLMLGIGAQVTKAILAEAQTQKLDVMLPEDLRKLLGPKVYEELRKCHGNVACAGNLLSTSGCARAVLGEVGRTDKHYTLKLWLFDLQKTSVIADVDRHVLIAARRFIKDVEQAVPPLLRGEQESRGTMKITSNVENAQVTMDGEFLGTAPITMPLKPGKYEVKVERPKYLTVQRFVTIEPGQTTDQLFKLLLKPGEVADSDVLPGLVKVEPKKEPAQGPTQLSALTYVAGGATIASAGVGLFFALSVRAGDEALLQNYNPDTGVYQGTRRQALAVQQQALAANISWGVTGAFAAATIVSVIIDASAGSPAPVQVTPVATPGGAGVMVGGTF